MKFSIRLLYLYLFSFIGLLVVIFGSIRLIQLGIKVYIFNGADQYNSYITLPASPDGKHPTQNSEEQARQQQINREENTKQRQREVAESLAMLFVGIPLYLYHWKMIQKESSKKN